MDDLFGKPWAAQAERVALKLLARGASDVELVAELNRQRLHPAERPWTCATLEAWRKANGLPPPLPEGALRALELRARGAALQDIARVLGTSEAEALALSNAAARLQAEAAG